MSVEKEENSEPANEARQNQQGNSDNDIAIARWTKVVGVFTVVLAVATIASAYFLWVTDETLRMTLEVNQRPWVSTQVELAGPFIFDMSKPWSSVTLKITSKNHGLSMARDVRTFPVMYPGEIAAITTEEIEQTRCRKPRNNAAFGDVGFALFPGQERIEILAPSLTPEDIGRVVATVAHQKQTFAPVIIVCVSYKTSVETQFHYTTAIFGLHGKDEAHPNSLIALDIRDAPIAPERMYLWNLGSFAD